MKLYEDAGVELDAAFRLEPSGRGDDVVLRAQDEASEGRAMQNPHCAAALETLLVRLRADGLAKLLRLRRGTSTSVLTGGAERQNGAVQ